MLTFINVVMRLKIGDGEDLGRQGKGTEEDFTRGWGCGDDNRSESTKVPVLYMRGEQAAVRRALELGTTVTIPRMPAATVSLHTHLLAASCLPACLLAAPCVR